MAINPTHKSANKTDIETYKGIYLLPTITIRSKSINWKNRSTWKKNWYFTKLSHKHYLKIKEDCRNLTWNSTRKFSWSSPVHPVRSFYFLEIRLKFVETKSSFSIRWSSSLTVFQLAHTFFCVVWIQLTTNCR